MDFRDFIAPLTLVISIFLGGRFKRYIDHEV